MRRMAFRGLRCVVIGVSAALLMGCGTPSAPAQAGDAAGEPQESGIQEEKIERDGAKETPPGESGAQETGQGQQGAAEPLADGSYTVAFDTDSSMFHLNESCAGRAKLTVKDGVMTVHVPLVSKSIVNLFLGTAEEARAAGASGWLQPVTETVTYDDGYTEEVYAFDVPVPAVDTEFELALIGTKGKWYDHTVCVTDPQLLDELENGAYRVKVTLVGGTGRADIESPAYVTVSDAGIVAKIVWSSPYYDYMLVDGVRYEPVNTDGNAVFEIPVAAFDKEIAVTADTVAMSVPHEIAYTLIFERAGAVFAE